MVSKADTIQTKLYTNKHYTRKMSSPNKSSVSNDTIPVFQTLKQEAVTYTFESKTIQRNIENKKVDKKETRKNWLITTGAIVGSVIIGTTLACLTKKAPTKIAGDLAETVGKLDDIEVFRNLKMCKNLTPEEKNLAYEYLIKKGNNKNVFLGVLSGDKPVASLSAIKNLHSNSENPLNVLRKLDLGDNIEWVKGRYWNNETNNFFNDCMINKKSLFEIIKNNKEIYTKRLDLSKTSSTKKIYNSLINYSINNNGLPNDLFGITLGFPKYDSMIFHIDNMYNLNNMRQSTEYVDNLLKTFKKEDFPYKNIDKKTLNNLIKSIKNINQENFKNISLRIYNDGLYQFINFCNDQKELERISRATKHFMKMFNPLP